MERALGCNDDARFWVVVERHPDRDAGGEDDRGPEDDDEQAGHKA